MVRMWIISLFLFSFLFISRTESLNFEHFPVREGRPDRAMIVEDSEGREQPRSLEFGGLRRQIQTRTRQFKGRQETNTEIYTEPTTQRQQKHKLTEKFGNPDVASKVVNMRFNGKRKRHKLPSSVERRNNQISKSVTPPTAKTVEIRNKAQDSYTKIETQVEQFENRKINVAVDVVTERIQDPIAPIYQTRNKTKLIKSSLKKKTKLANSDIKNTSGRRNTVGKEDNLDLFFKLFDVKQPSPQDTEDGDRTYFSYSVML